MPSRNRVHPAVREFVRRFRQRDPEWVSKEIDCILHATQREWKRGDSGADARRHR